MLTMIAFASAIQCDITFTNKTNSKVEVELRSCIGTSCGGWRQPVKTNSTVVFNISQDADNTVHSLRIEGTNISCSVSDGKSYTYKIAPVITED